MASLPSLINRTTSGDGVINAVPTSKHVIEFGKEMCKNRVVKKVTFTGSQFVAKLICDMTSSK